MKCTVSRQMLIGVAAVGLSLFGCNVASAQNFSDIKPSPQQVEWQDLEFGVIIHFGTNTFLDREWGDGKADASVFNPTQLDTDQWMKTVKDSGAKYVVLVAKHHDGFCLWPTEQTSYSVKQSPWEDGKGDLVRLAANSAKKYGLKFGIYLSPWDRHDPRYSNPAEYDKYYLSQLRELVSKYGDLTELWLDGAGSDGRSYDFAKIIDVLRTYQPNALVFADTALFEFGDIRWVGNESGSIGFENWNVVDRHGYLRWRPVEVDTPLRKRHWFWHPNDEASLASPAELVNIYENSVGRGGQLLLGLAPDRRGLLPEQDVMRLREFGKQIEERFAHNLAAEAHVVASRSIESALDGNTNTFWSATLGSHSSTLEIDFANRVTFDHAVTMEWLNDGQHVQKYAIEVWNGAGWEPVASGYSIGHKKIDSFPPVSSRRVRLNIISSSSEAHIREFQLFKISK